ncbi:MAG TPA: hypothetical protein P5186_21310 [Candidatus Paceibacterota bacterium]|nr:hypothetical protein [Verrucomicrobiota bacterium]HRY50597.1 hypothetical protein [Candidatus Paceibacterota bacterium]
MKDRAGTGAAWTAYECFGANPPAQGLRSLSHTQGVFPARFLR